MAPEVLSPGDYAEFRPLMFSIAYRMTGSISDAEDIVQEAFLRLTRVLRDGTSIDSPKAFLATVTTRLAISYLRSARVRRESYVGAWLPEPLLADPDPDPAERAEMSDSLSMAFLVLLESLTPTERAVFLLHEVFGYDYKEIAGITGKSETNCRQILTRARHHVDDGKPRFDASREQREEVARRFFAAAATAAAVTRGAPGIYNIVDDDPAPVREWLPYLAECLGAKAPMRAPAWLGGLLAGQLVVSLMTRARGSVNEKAKQELGWAPQYASWRDGFRDWAKTAGQGRAA